MQNLDLDALAKKAETLIEKKQQSRMTIKEMRDYSGLNNVHYAPGFATYGLRGLTRQFNSSAQSIYISDLDYSDGTQQLILNKLRDGIPLSTRDELVNLIASDKIDYHLGDLVITPNGNVYIIASTTSLDKPITYKTTAHSEEEKYKLILNFLFKIDSKSFNSYNLDQIKSLTIGRLDPNNTRTITNGILTIKSSSSSTKNPHIRLISSNNITDSSKITFDELKIYYSDNKWIFESGAPLEFKANKISVNKSKDQSEILSKVNALEEAIGDLKSVMDNITVDTNAITIGTAVKDKIVQVTKLEAVNGLYKETKVEFTPGEALIGESFNIYLTDGHILNKKSQKNNSTTPAQ